MLALKGTAYTIDDVWAVIPVGARKPGSSTLYFATFDGANLRCNAEVGADLMVYIFHALEV